MNARLPALALLGTALLLLALFWAFEPKRAPESLAPNPARRVAGLTLEDGRAKIRLNEADEALLGQLPGIGRALAGRILRDRAENGPFSQNRALLRVPGIGEGKYARIEPYLSAD